MFTPCSPESNGLTHAQIDSYIFSLTATKQRFVKDEWCSNCPARAKCEDEGKWYNLEGIPQIAEGIFGGLTKIERENNLTYPLG